MAIAVARQQTPKCPLPLVNSGMNPASIKSAIMFQRHLAQFP